MAKDGTNRGGKRPGAGRPRKALSQKILEGNLGKRALKVIEFKGDDNQKQVMPKPAALLGSKQAGGKMLNGQTIFKDAWEWINERKCANLIPPQLLERYAMSMARWMQAEASINVQGLVPEEGGRISPFVDVSLKYMTAANRLWAEIYQIIKENNEGEYSPVGGGDLMEQMLMRRSG